jgi:hypothetical protein
MLLRLRRLRFGPKDDAVAGTDDDDDVILGWL